MISNLTKINFKVILLYRDINIFNGLLFKGAVLV